MKVPPVPSFPFVTLMSPALLRAYLFSDLGVPYFRGAKSAPLYCWVSSSPVLNLSLRPVPLSLRAEQVSQRSFWDFPPRSRNTRSVDFFPIGLLQLFPRSRRLLTPLKGRCHLSLRGIDDRPMKSPDAPFLLERRAETFLPSPRSIPPSKEHELLEELRSRARTRLSPAVDHFFFPTDFPPIAFPPPSLQVRDHSRDAMPRRQDPHPAEWLFF